LIFLLFFLWILFLFIFYFWGVFQNVMSGFFLRYSNVIFICLFPDSSSYSRCTTYYRFYLSKNMFAKLKHMLLFWIVLSL